MLYAYTDLVFNMEFMPISHSNHRFQMAVVFLFLMRFSCNKLENAQKTEIFLKITANGYDGSVGKRGWMEKKTKKPYIFLTALKLIKNTL